MHDTWKSMTLESFFSKQVPKSVSAFFKDKFPFTSEHKRQSMVCVVIGPVGLRRTAV